jgi:RNA polymerase sigma-70 factor, ECF subfamily
VEKNIAKRQVTVRPSAQAQHHEPSAAFEELAMPLFDSLYNLARWLTLNRQDAEDLVQETYTKALRGFSTFQVGTNFRAWIYRILRNTFLSSRSGLRATMTVSLESQEDGPEVAVVLQTPETFAIERSNQRQVQAALEELPIHFREILLLCDVEEMSYREIAEALSVPMGTVMSRVARARKALRLALANTTVVPSPSRRDRRGILFLGIKDAAAGL